MQEFCWKLLPGRNRKWCLELHATCLIFDIIRQSLALPLVQTGNDGWVPFLKCQLTWVHATFLWYSRVSAIALSLWGSVWLFTRPIFDRLLYMQFNHVLKTDSQAYLCIMARPSYKRVVMRDWKGISDFSVCLSQISTSYHVECMRFNNAHL